MPVSKVPLIPAGLVEAEQRFEIVIGDGPAIGAAGQRRKDLLGARQFVARGARGGTRKFVARLGVSPEPAALNGSGDADAEDVREALGIAGVEGAALEGLHQVFG